MPDIVGVRFKKAGKVYYFDPSGVEIQIYDHVVVQTARGVEMGQVTIAPKQVLASELTAELKPIVRRASEEDIRQAQDFADKENEALVECHKMINRQKLPMKLVSAEYNLDGSRLTFYFTADERVDFRELVRELTSFFRTRIELRQIGPRDQAKLVGGLGRCGRSLCCISFLSEFNPVSIRMAKEQDLPLDPMKISGVCGRLQCCLAYENQQYHEAKALLPKRGQAVETPVGLGVIIGGNPMKETVLVEMESKAEVEFPVSQIKIIHESAKPQPVTVGKEEAPEEVVLPVTEVKAAEPTGTENTFSAEKPFPKNTQTVPSQPVTNESDKVAEIPAENTKTPVLPLPEEPSEAPKSETTQN
jgi:cell fate regulator YaaT (PSP1 superfamily)